MNTEATVVETTAFSQTLSQIRALRAWKAGWNGYDALAPDPDAVTHALEWIQKMYKDVRDSGRAWIAPNVTASADGDVVFEWWSGEKKLTVYVSAQEAEYVTVAGPDIFADMGDGDTQTAESRRTLWVWLTS
jgi:hypothetical protein